MNDRNEQICRFLSQYIELEGGSLLPSDEEYLKDGIALLIENNVMSKEEILREAVKEYNVIIPHDMFPHEL